MNVLKFSKMAIATIAIATMTFAAKATTLDFGTSWPASFTGQGAGNYSAAPLNRVVDIEAGTHSNETAVKNVLNSLAGTSYVAADVHKTNQPITENGGSNGYFTVAGGWKYLVVQYDGPNGGSVVVELDGNDAKVPYDSALIWGTGDQYGVSHYSVVGEVPAVPDGGSTVALLGLGVAGMAALRRKVSK